MTKFSLDFSFQITSSSPEDFPTILLEPLGSSSDAVELFVIDDGGRERVLSLMPEQAMLLSKALERAVELSVSR